MHEATVHCRLCPGHSLTTHSPSLGARHRHNQYNTAGALLCARRRNDVTRCNVIDMFPYGPLCVNLTSSTKPEVHNISQRRQGRTEPLPQVRCTKICRRLGVQFPRYAGGQTNTRTDTIDTILRYLPLPGAE